MITVPNNGTLRVIELFAGYGSQRMALERLRKAYPTFNYEVVGISEIEPNALKAYEAIHGDCPNMGDITKIDWSTAPDCDLVTWSFPCQSISSAGLQHGFAEDSGTRSSLAWECVKMFKEKRPAFMLMENVSAILQKKFRNDLAALQKAIEDLGYTNYTQLMNAKDYNVPQNRSRCFMLSIRKDLNIGFSFPKVQELKRRVLDLLEKNVDQKYYLSDERVAAILRHCERKVAEGCGFKTNFTTGEGISGAIKTKEGCREYDTYIAERK
jgi:DNA (cytosine-5)-methyltransferase 1